MFQSVEVDSKTNDSRRYGLKPKRMGWFKGPKERGDVDSRRK